MRKTMSILSLWVAAALVAGGCANYKEPARLAIQETEYSMKAVSFDAKKYVPDQYAQLEKDFEAAKASYDDGEYKQAVGQIRALRNRISEVSAAAATAREQKVAELKQQWESMSADLPKMVDAIQRKVDSLSRTKRLPKNVTQTGFDAAKASFEEVKQLWTEASQAADEGNVEAAVNKGTTVQTKSQEIMSMLGMPSSTSA